MLDDDLIHEPVRAAEETAAGPVVPDANFSQVAQVVFDHAGERVDALAVEELGRLVHFHIPGLALGAHELNRNHGVRPSAVRGAGVERQLELSVGWNELANL